MKLTLPNNEDLYLPDEVPLAQKLKIVDAILDEWEDYFREAWYTPRTKACLYSLASYLCRGYHRDKNVAKGKRLEDTYVWSRMKEKRVRFGDGVTVLFSDLPKWIKIRLGVPHCYNEDEENQE